MRLLFLTQTLDRADPLLGFVPRWVEAFAARAERVRVVALALGAADGLPANVDVRVVGRRGILLRGLRYRAFLREALFRDGFDAVLAHMVPRYATLAAGPARRAGAGLFLWYTHSAVDERLRRAERVVDAIFTASPESLRLDTPKKTVTGHGIDLAHFDALGVRPLGAPRLLSVGRLAPAKDPLTVVEALALLRAEGRDVALDLVGAAAVDADRAYAERVRRRIDELGLGTRVVLHAAVPYARMPEHYRRAAACVNASSTGSLDKVVLEAMACERPVLSSSAAFPGVVAALGEEARALCFPHGDGAALAQRLRALLDRTPEQRAALGERLRGLVARDHEVEALVARLCARMERRP